MYSAIVLGAPLNANVRRTQTEMTFGGEDFSGPIKVRLADGWRKRSTVKCGSEPFPEQPTIIFAGRDLLLA